jgi:hypothetical protein
MRLARAFALVLVTGTWAASWAAPGDNCTTPITVTLPADLPFADTNQHTCGRGNDYDGSNTCIAGFTDGEDIIYRLVVDPSPVEITVVLDPKGQPGTLLLLAGDCPPASGCLDYCADETAAERVLQCRYLEPGIYTLMVDCWPEFGPCIDDFDLSISACTLPHGACCLNLSCLGTMPAEPCAQAGGTWYPDFDCDNSPCPILIEVPDTCQTAYVVPPTLPFSARVVSSTATAGPPPGSCNEPDAPVMQKDVWFQYTPEQAGTVTVWVQYELYNGLTAIYDGTSCTELHEITCLNADGQGPFTVDTATLPVDAGTTYWLQIGDYGTNGSGGGTLLVLDSPVTIVTGDVNCSGDVGFDDINPFVLLLSNPTVWQTTFPGCPALNGDINHDGSVGFGDINPFVALLAGGRP